MCDFDCRTFNCGHWKKVLTHPCNDAKKNKKVCDPGNENFKTTGMYCEEDGCDGKPDLRRDGPDGIEDGGFDSDDVDWDDYSGAEESDVEESDVEESDVEESDVEESDDE